MIHVIVTGPPKTGFYPYRVDWWMRGRPQLVGAWPLPLYDACWKLKQMGLMDDTQVALFEGDDPRWRIRTTVGEGYRKWLEPLETVMGQYREFPGGPLKDTPNKEPPIVGVGEAAASSTFVPPAKSEAPPPPPHTPPEPLVDKGPAHASPDKPHQSHHRPRPKGSGARRGSR